MKKNYFETLNIPENVDLEDAVLQAAYRAGQMESHPDRQGSLEYSTHLNDAYRTLKDPVKRALYLLELRGITVDLETDTRLDPMFLSEQLTLRETLHELSRFPDNQEALCSFKETVTMAKKGKMSDFSKAYRFENYEEARNNVRELQFFCRLEVQVKDLLC